MLVGSENAKQSVESQESKVLPLPQHRGHASSEVDEPNRHQELPDEIAGGLVGSDLGQFRQEPDAERQCDELYRLLRDGGREHPQPLTAPTGGLRQNPETHCRRGKGQQQVNECEPQDHLEQQVEAEDGVDQIDEGQQQRDADRARLDGGQKRVDRGRAASQRV